MDNENRGNIEILLVDDEKDFISTMEFWLRSQGYRVSTASNGPEAIESIQKQKPNIVFLDINMPGMDGVETLRRIREVDPDLPVVMLTAYGSPENREAAYRYKSNAFFDKSKDFYEADHIIKSVLHFFTKTKKDSQEKDK